MANGPALEHAIDLSINTIGLDLGIHLCLNDLLPVCQDFTYNLVDGNGMFFHSYPKVIKKIIMVPGILSQIKAEFRCQIEHVLNRNIVLSHINSHKHLHIFPPLWQIVSELAEEYKIPFIRYPVEGLEKLAHIYFTKGNGKKMKDFFYFFAFCLFFNMYFQAKRTISKDFIKSADFFIGLFNTGFLDALNIIDYVKGLRPGITELMCHPGYVDDDLFQLPTRLVYSRQEEVQALCSPEVMQAIKDNNIEVISFNECC